jgi:hypothetical protein
MHEEENLSNFNYKRNKLYQSLVKELNTNMAKILHFRVLLLAMVATLQERTSFLKHSSQLLGVIRLRPSTMKPYPLLMWKSKTKSSLKPKDYGQELPSLRFAIFC